MEDEGIKSALELAMERISSLPQLTPREIAEQKERDNAPVGNALSSRYIAGLLSESELPVELSRFDGERRKIILRALIASLCRELRLENSPATAQKALLGATALVPQAKAVCEEAVKSFELILGEFETARIKRSGEFSVLASRKINERGIRGSSVRPNLNESEEWKQLMDGISREYEPKLENLRNELLREISGRMGAPEYGRE